MNTKPKIDAAQCDHVCVVCGKHEQGRWMSCSAIPMREHQLCFGCNHWREKLALLGNPNVARVQGVHYTICHDDNEFRGYGGQRFVIRFNDGRIVTTRNLWCQGDIPPQWRERLPDNATFLDGM